jgi:selenocysteine lyase/cysteine desulfurase
MHVQTREPTVLAAQAFDSRTVDFAALRCTEYERLDAGGHAYLDYTGAGLYAASQIDAHHRRLLGDVLGNPHSENPTSRDSTARMERARRRVLEFLHADSAEYDVAFTTNASAALRLVGESFPFSSGSSYVLTTDNHNSVNGIRRFAERAGAAVCYVPLDAELRVVDPEPWLRGARASTPHLFAFPAQSNFSGVRHRLELIERARSHGFHVLLDAAAFLPTAPLRLNEVHPDFVCLSFYKMFGFPTGVGTLVARREALAMLDRPWFAGGTVEWVSTQSGTHALRSGAQAFEDGTPHFLGFDAVCDGLDLLDSIGMSRIHARIGELTARLLAALTALRHPGGAPVVEVYGPADTTDRGGTVSFNALDGRGAHVPFERVVERAARQRVSLRGGCFCNPGCAETALAIPANRARACREALGPAYTPERFAACMGGPIGAVRASLGVPTLSRDIDRLVHVLEQFRGSRH